MDIHSYKAQFDQFMLLSTDAPSVEESWRYFKDSLRNSLDGVYVEEFAFKAGYVSYSESIGSLSLGTHKVITRNDKNVFRIYFGRTIDSKEFGAWGVAEINFYFHYEMNDALRFIAEQYPNCYIEEFYDSAEDTESISKNKETVIAFADEKKFIWDSVRGLKPIEREIYFLLD